MAKHIIVGLTYASIFGLTFMFTKIGLSHISPVGLMAFRFSIATLILLVLKYLNIIKINISKPLVLSLLTLVIFQPIIGFTFEMYGVFYSQSSEAGMIIALIPVFVSILSLIFTQEKPSIRQSFFIVLSVFGVMFIQWMNVSGIEGFSVLGASLMLISALAAASFNMLSRQLSKTVSPGTITFVMMSIGSIFFMTWYIIDTVLSGSSFLDLFRPLKSFELITSLLYLGGIASVIGFFLVNYNLKHIPAHISSIFANVATIVSIIAGLVFLNETLYWYHFAGSFMIMIGVYGVVSSRHIESEDVNVQMPL